MNESSVQPYYYDSSDRGNWLVREIKELARYRDLIWQLTIRNVTIRYKRSFLGVLWTLLEPLLSMVVMSIVFTAILSRRVPNFPVYLLVGYTVWEFFAQATNSAMREFLSSERLVSRVYLPQSIFIVVAITTGLANFLIQLAALLVIALFLTGSLSVFVPTILLPILILAIFNLGLGLILAPLGAYFKDVNNIYNIMLRLLIYLSALHYPLDLLPPDFQRLVSYNPIYRFILMFRNPIYSGAMIDADSLIYTSLWAIGLLAIGMFLFSRLADDIAARM